MREADADTYWCPFARKASSTAGYNRTASGDPAVYCLGKKCIAWVISDRINKVGHCGLVKR